MYELLVCDTCRVPPGGIPRPLQTHVLVGIRHEQKVSDRPTNPHGFAVSLTISAAISRSHKQRLEFHDFFSEFVNSHELSAKTHDFSPPSSKLVGHISRFQAHR